MIDEKDLKKLLEELIVMNERGELLGVGVVIFSQIGGRYVKPKTTLEKFGDISSGHIRHAAEQFSHDEITDAIQRLRSLENL